MKTRVEFKCQGSRIVGNLFAPEKYKEGEKLPAVIVAGPATSVKEQVVGTYAERLARRGFVALSFDYRTYGESEGEPRSSEDLFRKSEDIKSAVSFMRALAQVNKDQVGVIGICGGAAALVQTLPGERRIRAAAIISGTLRLRDMIGASGGDAILELAADARQKYDETGEVTYLPLFSKRASSMNRFNREAYEYYVGNQDKHPRWRGDVDLSSFPGFAAFDISTTVPSIAPSPILFIAGSEAMTGPLSQNAYDHAKEPKELYWIEGASHIDLYHKEEYINQATEKLDEFFKEQLT
jgi:hypothetical protein